MIIFLFSITYHYFLKFYIRDIFATIFFKKKKEGKSIKMKTSTNKYQVISKIYPIKFLLYLRMIFFSLFPFKEKII